MRLGLITLVFSSVALSSASQIVMKFGMTSQTVLEAIQSHQPVRIAKVIATSPSVLGGLVCYGLSASLWLFVLSQIPLSSAYPFVALGIMVTVLAGWSLLGEPLSLLKLTGVGLILVGIMLVALDM